MSSSSSYHPSFFLLQCARMTKIYVSLSPPPSKSTLPPPAPSKERDRRRSIIAPSSLLPPNRESRRVTRTNSPRTPYRDIPTYSLSPLGLPPPPLFSPESVNASYTWHRFVSPLLGLFLYDLGVFPVFPHLLNLASARLGPTSAIKQSSQASHSASASTASFVWDQKKTREESDNVILKGRRKAYLLYTRSFPLPSFLIP